MIFRRQFLLAALVGLVRRDQDRAITYLMAEVEVLKKRLRTELGPRRLLLTNEQRRLLAIKGKTLGLKELRKYASIFSPARPPKSRRSR